MKPRRLATPFLTTVATAATLLGCGTTVVFEAGADEAGTGGSPTGGGTGGTGGSATGGGTGGSGGSPLPCPVDKPEHTSSCAGFSQDQACPYLSDPPCPEIPIDAICDQGEWQVPEPLCNPPPPQPCVDYSDPNLCESDPACRWIVPGCGDVPLDDARCFPALGCDLDPLSCTDSETCAEVSHNLCWNSSCQACHTPVYVCVGDDSDA